MTTEARHAARRHGDAELSRRSAGAARDLSRRGAGAAQDLSRRSAGGAQDLSRRSAAGAKADVGARHAAHLRALNLERVLAFAGDQPGSFTRAEVIQATGLSAPTVGTLCAQLIRSGVVTDLGTGPSRGGRRPASMQFNARYGYVAGIDIGPTRTRLAVADLHGERLAHRVVATPNSGGPDQALSRLAGELRTLLSESRVPIGRLLAVSAGPPGV